MTSFDINQQVKAVEREIKFREFVYPNRVRARKMKLIEADFQIDIMKKVLQTLKEVAANKPFELE